MKTATMDMRGISKVEWITAQIIIAEHSTEASIGLDSVDDDQIEGMVENAVKIAKKIVEKAKE